MNRSSESCEHLLTWVSLLFLAAAASLNAAETDSVAQLSSDSVTNEFRLNHLDGTLPHPSTTVSAELGAARGLSVFGTREAHDLALSSFSLGHVFAQTVGADHWYRGNWELRLELLGGAQFSPSTHWFVALTPHLRYNFATEKRLVPFLDAGPGAMLTEIGKPDLGTRFEFNLQAGLGVHWFLRDRLALTVEGKFFHISNASIQPPNHGVNDLLGLVGLTWFF